MICCVLQTFLAKIVGAFFIIPRSIIQQSLNKHNRHVDRSCRLRFSSPLVVESLVHVLGAAHMVIGRGSVPINLISLVLIIRILQKCPLSRLLFQLHSNLLANLHDRGRTVVVLRRWEHKRCTRPSPCEGPITGLGRPRILAFAIPGCIGAGKAAHNPISRLVLTPPPPSVSAPVCFLG